MEAADFGADETITWLEFHFRSNKLPSSSIVCRRRRLALGSEAGALSGRAIRLLSSRLASARLAPAKCGGWLPMRIEDGHLLAAVPRVGPAARSTRPELLFHPPTWLSVSTWTPTPTLISAGGNQVANQRPQQSAGRRSNAAAAAATTTICWAGVKSDLFVSLALLNGR